MTAVAVARSTDRPLRGVLLADAGVGFLVATAFLLGTALYTELTGLPEAVLRWAAVILLGYVAVLTLAALLRPLRRGLVIGLVVANAAWLLASLVLLTVVPTTPFGAVYVVGQGLVAAGFGVAEFVLLRRVRD